MTALKGVCVLVNIIPPPDTSLGYKSVSLAVWLSCVESRQQMSYVLFMKAACCFCDKLARNYEQPAANSRETKESQFSSAFLCFIKMLMLKYP